MKRTDIPQEPFPFWDALRLMCADHKEPWIVYPVFRDDANFFDGIAYKQEPIVQFRYDHFSRQFYCLTDQHDWYECSLPDITICIQNKWRAIGIYNPQEGPTNDHAR